MSDFVIIDGDTLTVNFGATVIPQAQGPKPLSGSSPDFLVKSAPVCRQGDEMPPSLKGPLTYTEGAYSTPGQGTLAVSPNTTTVLKNGGIALLLQGHAIPRHLHRHPARHHGHRRPRHGPVQARHGLLRHQQHHPDRRLTR